MTTIAAHELTPEDLLPLAQEIDPNAELGPEGTNSVVLAVGDFTFIIETYATSAIVRVWTAMPLDSTQYDYESIVRDANLFNSNYLSARNFVFQDPEDHTDFRVIWDCDRIIGDEGLSDAMLATMITRLGTTIAQAFQNDSQQSC